MQDSAGGISSGEEGIEKSPEGGRGTWRKGKRLFMKPRELCASIWLTPGEARRLPR